MISPILIKKSQLYYRYLFNHDFYFQCCNDVIEDRFSSELRYDVAFRLAALHMQQYVAVHNMQHKLSIKAVE